MTPGIHLDFSEVEDSDFEPIPAGIYTGVIDEIEERESKSGPHPYLNWTLIIGGDGEFSGRKLWMMTSFSPKALWRLRDTLIGLGCDAKKLKQKFEFDPVNYINVPVQIEVSQETYDGKLQNRVDSIKAIGGVAGKKPAARRA